MAKKNRFGGIQKFGKALMVPVALLPAAGILLGLGAAFSGPLADTFPVLQAEWVQTTGAAMTEIGISIFEFLPIIFAIGVAIGLSGGSGIAGLAALVGYIIMNKTISFALGITPDMAAEDARYGMAMGIPTLETGVLGGIAVGILAVYVHKRFKNYSPPEMLGFFSGERSVGIVMAFFSIFLGLIVLAVWPTIQVGIAAFANVVASDSTNPLLVGLYGFINRILIPTGLHHIWYGPFFWTQLGGSVEINGQMVSGDQYIFLRQIAEGEPVTAGRFMAGNFAPMFGLAGAALAMYRLADKKNKAKVKGLLIAAAGTALVTGITEPIEFTFLFVAPLLYVFHSIAVGFSFIITYIFEIRLGWAGGSGLIDYILVNALPNTPNWWMNLILGAFLFVLYYVVFSFAIKKWNLATPGRAGQANQLFTRKDYEAKKNHKDSSKEEGSASDNTEIEYQILAALGGKENLEDIDACFTRLRLEVNDLEKLDEEKLKDLGAAGVIKFDNNVQVVFGGKADNYKNRIKAIIEETEKE